MRDPETTSRIMASVRSRDTGPELALRRTLHRHGVRYRVRAADVPGHPDLAIRKYRLAVFIDGDMWHGNEHIRRGLPDLESLFPSRAEFWCEKIRRNMARDEEVNAKLRAEGWTVVRIWASDVEIDVEAAAHTVIEALDIAKASRVQERGTRNGIS